MANDQEQNNKDKLAVTPSTEGASLAERHKIGAPVGSLHKRVASAATLADASKQTLAQQAAAKKPLSTNPFDLSVDMANRIGLMLDVSSSMGSEEQGKTKIQHLKDACQNFIDACDFSNTAIAIETFPEAGMEDDEEYLYNRRKHELEQDPLAHLLPSTKFGQAHVQQPGKIGMCNVPAMLKAHIDQLQDNGGTPMAPAMQRMLTRNSLTRGVLISDGEADNVAAAEGYAHEWKKADIPIDTVHIGNGSGAELLKRIAAITGGMFFKFDNVAAFAKNFHFLTPAFRGMLTSGSANMLGAKEIK
jgi:Mg-chelatase subunit ChlD